jgi:hypothetical protein
MSYYTQAFAPDYGKGVTVAPGVASAVQAFPNNASAVELTNLSSTIRCSVRFGETAALTADLSADYTVMPGMKCVITKQRGYEFFAYIGSGAAGSLQVIPGEGL